MRYKLAPCGCVTDENNYIEAMCQTHRSAVINPVPEKDQFITKQDKFLTHTHAFRYSAVKDLSICDCGEVKAN